MSKSKKNKKETKRIPVEVYSRVVGYFRPVNQWNKGKQAEYSDRNDMDPETTCAALDRLLEEEQKKTA